MSSQPSAHSSIPEGEGEKVDNTDMGLLKKGAEAKVLSAVDHPKIKDCFDYFETAANRAKKWHTRVGFLSLALLILVLEFSVLRLLFLSLGQGEKVAHAAHFFTILGVLPFLGAIGLAWRKIREKWILSRYKAERVRHWKFQQLMDGPYIESLQTSASIEDQGFIAQWSRLVDGLEGGAGEMRAFINNRPFSCPFVHKDEKRQHYADAATWRSAAEIYSRRRLDVQLHWFNQESEHFQKLDHHSESFASLLLLLSIIAAFLDGILVFIPSLHHPALELSLLAFGVAAAVLSAGVRVYRSASGVSESAERYQRMAAQLEWHRNNYHRILDHPEPTRVTQSEIFKVMHEIERLCHGELQEFVRVSQKSDYLF